jgi:hypothetical protein
MECAKIAPMVGPTFAYRIPVVNLLSSLATHTVFGFEDWVSHFIAPPQIRIFTTNLRRLFPTPLAILFANPAHTSYSSGKS